MVLESIPVLKMFLQLSDSHPNYVKERIDASTHIYSILTEYKQADEAYEALQSAVELLRAAFKAGNIPSQVTFAKFLMKYAFALRRRSQEIESIRLAQEAAHAWETICKRDPERLFYQERHAFVLRKLAAWQIMDDRLEGAVSNIDKAVKLLRKLKDTDEKKYGQLYGLSLLTLADAKAQNGDREAALKNAKASLDVINKSTEQNNSAISSARAEALYTYGKLLVDTDLKSACERLDEAFHIYDEALRETKLTSLKLKFASAANEAARAHAKQRQFKTALNKSRRAVNIVQKLYEKFPRHGERLANLMETKVECLLALKKWGEASKGTEELFALRTKLSGDKPRGDQRLGLAMAIQLQATCFSKSGRQEKANEKADEAIKLMEKEAKARPNDFIPSFVAILTRLSDVYHEDGKNNKALKIVKRAIEYANGFNDGGDSIDILEILAEASFTVAKRNLDLKNVEDAVAELHYTIEAFHDLATQNHTRFDKSLFMALDMRQKHLVKLGQHKEAVQVLQLKVEARREQGKDGQAELAAALDELSAERAKVGKGTGALEAAEEAVKIARKLKDSKNGEINLGLYLATLGMRQKEVGDDIDAKKTFKQSQKILEEQPEASSTKVNRALKAVQKELKAFK